MSIKERNSAPAVLKPLQHAAKNAGFDMMSDPLTGNLLATLAASKPGGRLLELGTGVGLGTAWLLSGMDDKARLETVEMNPDLTAIAKEHLGSDERLEIYTEDGLEFLKRVQGQTYDLIFADTWPGKLEHPELALNLVAPGGLYIVDDMQDMISLPESVPGIDDEVLRKIPEQWRSLIALLEAREDFICTELRWSTGLMVCTKRALS